MKYKFRSYYKYTFSVEAEDGRIYYLVDDLCNSGDIYRLSIEAEGEMFQALDNQDGSKFEIDGYTFTTR